MCDPNHFYPPDQMLPEKKSAWVITGFDGSEMIPVPIVEETDQVIPILREMAWQDGDIILKQMYHNNDIVITTEFGNIYEARLVEYKETPCGVINGWCATIEKNEP